MIKKLPLYWNTVRYMKPSQVYFRIQKMLKCNCSLGVRPVAMPVQEQFLFPAVLPELDFDSVFLKRFSAEELVSGKVTFLHEKEDFSWSEKWECPDRTPLWNFNLHYFEFLLPLVKAYKDTAEEKYLKVVQDSIQGWIQSNPRTAGGPGWSAYTISLRIVSWLSTLTYLSDSLEADLMQRINDSLYEQYVHLANHLEKDLLANHYFENLKALVLLSLYFRDDTVLGRALKEFKSQCREQILPDGMHFELSPMYHKIILEDVIRVAAALRSAGKSDAQVEGYIQPMLDAAWSLENGLERIPLFNDGGDNVTKSLSALADAARRYFEITPVQRSALPDSGYYIFRQGDWTLIVDAGQPGPTYNMGHVHCDAMSFELFKAGKPVLVNCGTYAYQCDQRGFFRSTAAHNTVMAEGMEQSQCWSVFRTAKFARVSVKEVDAESICMEMKDWAGHMVMRKISMTEKAFHVSDSSLENGLDSFVHVLPAYQDLAVPKYGENVSCELKEVAYAPEYGIKQPVTQIRLTARDHVEYQLELWQ